MIDHAKQVASVVRGAFRTMHLLADGGKVKFGDWVPKQAATLEVSLARAYLASAKRDGADPELAEKLARAARDRALFAARSICDTSRERLEGGAEPKEVFSVERAASIGLTEASHAVHEARVIVAHSKGKRLRWVTDGKGKCKTCMALAGKTVKAGRPFVVIEGWRVLNPPLHPGCRCEVRYV